MFTRSHPAAELHIRIIYLATASATPAMTGVAIWEHLAERSVAAVVLALLAAGAASLGAAWSYSRRQHPTYRGRHRPNASRVKTHLTTGTITTARSRS
ncbi:hypothetical protein AB0I28_33020 [Phytomonospora sp. NPDC050363]|uniref:hypothetical protein n=1 Tax=Phytomonospora sp. NPDC050363 TaxID=3155642 RepID=UPI00341111CC